MFEPWLQRWWRPLLVASITLHVTQLFGVLLEPDAALYATIARHMAESGDFVNLIAYEQNWLDKPHLPFWLTAISFKLFGLNEVAYRLPGVAIFFIGVAYTWRLGRRLFDDTVAKLAVLMLLTSQHVVMSSADVRAEPFLIGFVTAAVFHSLRARESWKDLALGALFTALAMMTKGPFVVVPIVAANYRNLATWRVVPFALLTLAFISPELICLWKQFGEEGVRFFFWDGQFARFTNTWRTTGRGHWHFFLHTVLWSFLPWSFWLYAAVLKVRGPMLAAALSLFVLFSASSFQLAHYLNVAFPFFAVLVAAWVTTTRSRFVQVGLVLAVGSVVFGAWLLIINGSFVVAGALIISGVSAFVFCRETFGRMVLASLAFNFALGFAWWPELLRYQVGTEAAQLANSRAPVPTALIGVESLDFAFHLREPVQRFTVEDMKSVTHIQRALMHADSVQKLEGFEVTEVARYRHFHVSKLSYGFINSATRDDVTEPWILVELGR
ncbi:MAG: ArnT family glycosyltransferase [Archangium sp.]